jgi:hypothetical protein
MNRYVWLVDLLMVIYYLAKNLIDNTDIIEYSVYYFTNLFLGVIAIIIISFFIKDAYYYLIYADGRKKRNFISVLTFSLLGLMAIFAEYAFIASMSMDSDMF